MGDAHDDYTYAPPEPARPSSSVAARLLAESFPQLDPSLVESIFHACGRDANRASDHLLAIAVGVQGGDGSGQQQQQQEEGGGSWASRAAGGTRAAETPARDPLGELPADTLVCVVEFLGFFDQSNLASSSRHCRDVVRQAFARVPFLSFQPWWEDWRVLGMLRQFPAVESVLLRATDFDSFARLPSCAPRLVKLGAAGCRYLDDEGVQHLAAFLPELRELNLARTAVTDTALHHLAEHGGLEFLSLEGCDHVSGRAVARYLSRAGARLHGADLSGTQCTGDVLAPLELLQSALQRVLMKKCRRVASVCLSAPASPLSSLNLSSCPALERVRLRLPALASLNVSNCKRLREVAVRAPALADLNLSGCWLLAALTFDGPAALERVNLFQCKDVRAGDFRGMADAAGPALRCVNASGLINLPGSAAVHMVDTCERLEELELAGCKQVGGDDARHVARVLSARSAAAAQ